MSKLSLLIDLVLFMLLAVGYIVPVVYSPMSLAIAPFMIVGINLFITKMLFIPTAAARGVLAVRGRTRRRASSCVGRGGGGRATEQAAVALSTVAASGRYEQKNERVERERRTALLFLARRNKSRERRVIIACFCFLDHPAGDG